MLDTLISVAAAEAGLGVLEAGASLDEVGESDLLKMSMMLKLVLGAVGLLLLLLLLLLLILGLVVVEEGEVVGRAACWSRSAAGINSAGEIMFSKSEIRGRFGFFFAIRSIGVFSMRAQ